MYDDWAFLHDLVLGVSFEIVEHLRGAQRKRDRGFM